MDDRPIKLLERAELPLEHTERLVSLVRSAQALAAQADVELQSEFGKQTVALIVGCNQFVRFHRAGDHVGRMAMLLHPKDRDRLEAAGFTLLEPDGQVFRLFGWTAVEPMEGPVEALGAAVDAAFRRARG